MRQGTSTAAHDRRSVILIVDDLDVNRKLLRAQLVDAGHDVLEASNGVEALKVLRRAKVDVIVSDILMPRMDGYQLCVRVRGSKAFAGIPVIFFSATYTSTADRRFARSIGADAVLIKPVDVATLLATIRGVRRRSGRRRLTQRAVEVFSRDYAERVAVKLEEKNVELEAKKADLESREELLRTMIESAVELIFVTDLDGRILAANAAAVNATERPADQLRQFTLPDLVSPEYREAVVAAILRRGTASGDARYVEFPLRTPSGGLRWLGLNSTPRTVNGRIAGAYQIARDITDLRRAEEALRDSEARYRLLFEANPFPMWVFDKESLRFLAVNDTAVHRYGYSVDEFLAMTIKDIRPPDQIPTLLDRLAEDRTSIGTLGRAQHRTKDGRIIVAEITGHDIVFGGRPARLILAVDVTERTRLEEALITRERRLAAFFTGATAGLAIWDRDLRYMSINETLAEINGWRVEEHIGRTVADVLPDLERIIGPLLESVRDTGRPILNIDVSGATRKSPGVVRHWTASYFPIHGADERVESVGGIIVETTAWKKAAEALAASEAELRALFAAMDDLVIVLDPFGRYLQVAPTKPSNLVLPSDQLVGKLVSEVMRPEEARPILSAIREALDSQQAVRIEYHLRINDRMAWFEGTVSPMGHDAVIWVARDITERRRSDEVLAEMHRQLKVLFDSLDEAFFSIDVIENRAIQVSPAMERIFGQPVEAFYREPQLWKAMIVAEDRAVVDRQIGNLGDGLATRIQFRVRRPDGAVRWIEALIKPTLGPGGRLARVDGLAFDVTDRREAELRMREQADLLDKAHESISVRDLDGVVLYWNKGSERLYGYSAAEALGRYVGELLKAEPSSDLAEAMRIVRSEGEWVGKFHHRSKDGRSVIVESHWTLVRDNDGTPRSVFVINTDVTERTQLQSQLVHAQRMESLGTLAGGIAHDFNNILGIILAHASLIELHVGRPDKLFDGMNKIMTAADRGAGLVRQLLTFARKSEVVLGLVNINAVVEEVVTLLRQTMPRSIDIEVRLSPALPKILADANQLHQVLVNLGVNARDAMPRGGRLMISTELAAADEVRSRVPTDESAPFVRLDVHDTGSGMDESTKARIFDPFFTTKEHGKGTGLGLATVFGIVRSHNGYIDVRTELGAGTTFTIWFPVPSVDTEVKAQSPAEEAPPTGGSETILVVEDEVELLSVARAALESYGYTVLSASDGGEGWRQFTEHRGSIALVVTDLGLPKVDGPSFLTLLREAGSGVPVIVTSGFIEPEARRELEQLGVSTVIPKPYNTRNLVREIRTVLDRFLP